MRQAPLYSAHRYDENLVLKVPLLLWLVMVFLVRHLFLLLLSFLPRTGDTMLYLRDLVDPWYLLADLPAAAVLFAALLRRPDSPKWLRTLWNKGRSLLIFSALFYVVLVTLLLVTSTRPLMLSVNEALILSVLLHLAIVVYLARSSLVSDVLADFPRESAKRQDPG